jgi:hypothetical protein
MANASNPKVVLIASFCGTLMFWRSYKLVGFATGYGIKAADRNALIFGWATIICGFIFIVCCLKLIREFIHKGQ